MDIVAENLGKKYNREWIFRSLNIEIRTGDRLAITGANGSGKSTLLKILCNYLSPSEGSVRYLINGEVSDKEKVQLSFSLAAPYMNIIGEFTVQEMIDFHRKFKNTGFTTEEILESSRLHDASSKYVQELSSGMLQRLKLSLIFFFENEIIFLDEPTMNLDLRTIDWYHDQVRSLKKSQTVILASNQEGEYKGFDRIINIEDHKP